MIICLSKFLSMLLWVDVSLEVLRIQCEGRVELVVCCGNHWVDGGWGGGCDAYAVGWLVEHNQVLTGFRVVHRVGIHGFLRTRVVL